MAFPDAGLPCEEIQGLDFLAAFSLVTTLFWVFERSLFPQQLKALGSQPR